MANTVPSQTFLNLTIPESTRVYLGSADLSGGSWTITGLDSSEYNWYEIYMQNFGNGSNPAYMYLQLGDGATPTWRTDSNYHSQYREATSSSYHTATSQTKWGQTSNHMSIGYTSIPSYCARILVSGHLNLTDGAGLGYPSYEYEGWQYRNNGGLGMGISFRTKGMYVGSEDPYEAIRWVYQNGSFSGGSLYYWGIK